MYVLDIAKAMLLFTFLLFSSFEMLCFNKNVSNEKSSIKLKIYGSKMHFKTAHVFFRLHSHCDCSHSKALHEQQHVPGMTKGLFMLSFSTLCYIGSLFELLMVCKTSVYFILQFTFAFAVGFLFAFTSFTYIVMVQYLYQYCARYFSESHILLLGGRILRMKQPHSPFKDSRNIECILCLLTNDSRASYLKTRPNCKTCINSLLLLL